MQFGWWRSQSALAKSFTHLAPHYILYKEAGGDLPQRESSGALLRYARSQSQTQRVYVRVRLWSERDQPAQE